jgi:hypothetical protein
MSPSIQHRVAALRLGALLLAVPPTALHAQERDLGGLRPLGARVHVTTATLAGDTMAIGYTVENVRTGGEDLWGLLVAAPAPVFDMPAPARLRWGTHTRYNDRPIAGWMLYADTLLRPGEKSPELTLIARGIPGIVRYWAVPDLMANPPIYDDQPNRADYMTFSDSGLTVGVVGVPSGSTAASLATRLRTLLGRSCGKLGWIAQPGVCQSLDVKLAHAQDALRDGAPDAARRALDAFMHELEAQHGETAGKHVNDEAYALLRPNAAYLVSRF